MNKQQFVTELAKLRPSSTFLSLMGYRNSNSEIANYNIIFHINYQNALKKSILQLQSIVPENDLEALAKQDLIDGYNKSLNKISTVEIKDINDAYTRFFDEDGNYIKGVKLHTQTNVLHLYGFVNFKHIIMPGLYTQTNRQPLTIAKDKLRKNLPVEKFRQFKISPNQVDYISVQNISLLPPI